MITQFCLTKQGDLPHLSRSHEYYYQIQTQTFVCDVQYCDFCVFTFNDTDNGESTFHIERIQRDEAFWEECVLKSEDFFVTCLLSEVLGHWYTCSFVSSVNENPSTSSQLETDHDNDHNDESQLNEDLECDQEETFCYCNGPEEGNMICCDNSDCLIKWFQLTCLKLKRHVSQKENGTAQTVGKQLKVKASQRRNRSGTF